MTEETVHLTTGWEPGVPVSDGMVRRFLYSWVNDCETFVRHSGGRVERHDDVAFADAGRPVGFMNCVTLLRPLSVEKSADLMARAEAFFFAGSGSGMVVLFSLWPTPDLSQFGWNLMGHPPLHFRPAGGSPTPAPDGLRITRVEDLTGIRAFESVVVEGFPVEELQPLVPGSLFNKHAIDDPRRGMWIGWDGDRAVSAASSFVDSGVVNVDLVATLPDARRRGYAEALTWKATLSDPTLPAMLLSSDDGRKMYERMGFLPLQRASLWFRMR